MSSCTSFFNNRKSEIEKVCIKHNVSTDLLKRFWDISSHLDGDKRHE
ncbi:hypothetical protein [Metabacillus litoralis]|nr:hypothetical protein [Metabacillus litoralis]